MWREKNYEIVTSGLVPDTMALTSRVCNKVLDGEFLTWFSLFSEEMLRFSIRGERTDIIIKWTLGLTKSRS